MNTLEQEFYCRQMSKISYSLSAQKFFKNFELKYPIIQAPMSGLSTTTLAARVTIAGGLGSLPMGGNISNIELIKNTLLKYETDLKSLAPGNDSFSFLTQNFNKKVNLNFFSHEEPEFDESAILDWRKHYKVYFEEFYSQEHLDLKDEVLREDLKIFSPYETFRSIKDISHPLIQFLIEYRPLMISFHFGLPDLRIVNYLILNGITVFVSVTNPLEFLEVRQKYKNVNGFILQNYLAGGHRGNFIANNPADTNLNLEDLSTEINKVLVEEGFPDSKDLYMILAGGIAETSQIKTILAKDEHNDLFKNVSAVQLGSAFFLDDSLNLHPKLKHVLNNLNKNEVSPSEYTTLVTPSISGRNLRTLKTPFIERLDEDTKISKIPDYPLPYSINKRLVSKNKKIYGACLIGSNFQNVISLNGDQLVHKLFKDFHG